MTPKEQYEARKAARKERPTHDRAGSDVEMLDMFDRLVTALETIAEAYVRK